jgi:electron transfer flavoprotein alpha subunit
LAIKIDTQKCTACAVCVNTCPFGVLSIKNNQILIGEGCTMCGACARECPSDAITLEEPERHSEISGLHRGIWVFAEQHNGMIKNVAFELLAKARVLAAPLQSEVAAVCFGAEIRNADSLIAYGADKVFLVTHPELANNPEDVLTREFSRLIRQHRPEIVLAGATPLGRSFIPRVAAAIKCGLTADCTGLEIDVEKKHLLQTRPTFGGNIMATIICPTSRPQMSTVRPRTFKKGQPDSARRGQIIKIDLAKESVTSRTRLLEVVTEINDRVNLDEADIVVAGGRGLGKPENFQLVADLAGALGAAVASSRPPVDEGWLPYSHQVGQTGKTIAPRLYIACGISGAVQHLAGMQTAETIVAVNRDPNAPIFEIATYGLVGDLFQILPVLTERLKKE